MGLLALPDVLIRYIAGHVLNAGWDDDQCQWAAGDAEALRSFRLIHPRISQLCVDFVYSTDNITPLGGSREANMGLVSCSYHRMGKTTPHIVLRLGLSGQCTVDADQSCDGVGHTCNRRSFASIDSIIADNVFQAQGVKSFEVDLSVFSGMYTMPFYPKARAAIFGHPSARYFRVTSSDGCINVRILEEMVRLMQSPRSLRMLIVYGPDRHNRVQNGLGLYRAVTHQSMLRNLDLDMEPRDETPCPGLASSLPLPVNQPWSQLTHFRLKAFGEDFRHVLRPHVTASLCASASTLQSICTSMIFIVDCLRGTSFRKLVYLRLTVPSSTELSRIFNKPVDLGITFPSLETLFLDGRQASQAALYLTERPTMIPVLKVLELLAPLRENEVVDRVAEACASDNIVLQWINY